MNTYTYVFDIEHIDDIQHIVVWENNKLKSVDIYREQKRLLVKSGDASIRVQLLTKHKTITLRPSAFLHFDDKNNIITTDTAGLASM